MPNSNDSSAHLIRPQTARELALELARRVALALGDAPAAARNTAAPTSRVTVVRLSSPATPQERLLLAVARLQGTPIAVMPTRCRTLAEWLERFAHLRDPP